MSGSPAKGTVTLRSRRAVRDRARWPAAGFLLAVSVLAWVAAHRLAYLLGGISLDDHHGHGHGYLPVVEVAAGAVALVALAVFAAVARHGGIALRDACPRARRLLLCPVGSAIAFAAVESIEGSWAAGAPEVVLVGGIALQLLLGAIALVASQRVLHTVAAVVAGARTPRRVRGAPGALWSRLGVLIGPRLALLATSHAGRAPPRI